MTEQSSSVPCDDHHGHTEDGAQARAEGCASACAAYGETVVDPYERPAADGRAIDADEAYEAQREKGLVLPLTIHQKVGVQTIVYRSGAS